MISFNQKGNFNKTERFLDNGLRFSASIRTILDRYGQLGTASLAAATPVDTGLTASQWSYEINKTSTGFSISWLNSNVKDGVPVVILLQYGHGTRNGAYVQGRDFINPSIRPIFYMIADSIWKEVTNL